MTSKGKEYRDLRIKKIKDSINHLMEMLTFDRSRLDFIPLVFLKKLEKELGVYARMADGSSKFPIKKDKTWDDAHA